MTDIEQMIDDEIKYFRNRPASPFDMKDSLAKAIEQYVIKARIEELEIILTLSKHLHSQFALDIFNEGRKERIAELKKGLTK